MEKRKFFEKVKSWFVGLLVMLILVGVVVLLFVPDDSFSQISKSLSFWSKPKNFEIESLNGKITQLEKELKAKDDNKKEIEELKNQISALANQPTNTSTEQVQALASHKTIESRPITNPGNLEKRSLASQPTSSSDSSAVSEKPAETKSSSASTQTVSSKININTSSAAELDKLPGIGPTYAQRIIDYRDAHGGFKSISEIQNVKGIGPKTFEKLKDMIEI
ncbi:MAG: Competence protein ComEA helix-hairpin-helix repeat protein [Berkelbacteria bacterium GW2011_GWA2_38_9]|uniref:Competence protein ComEA helix-hairpin-helix repeat protein n=1 Tax=Berkelbacteria bacterium GW2011_GWA2_38_9 TaxID=1618334 RepID=A0A0G0LG12_9BACT|nr:MAG: Competence protein ComEA helix-hairpin-helix repeat protein [Berkelbacteria bacterium GW2011_GWA2_38_9]